MDPEPAPRDWNRISGWIAAALFLAGAGLVLLLPADFLIGSPRADIGQQFLAWRAFAASSLGAGHLPLWNPYSYSGEPFLGGFQSAVFYPPNLIFLVMPLCRAVNLSLLIHLFILGWGMRRWASGRGLHPLAAGLCGLILPLSGPVFPHLYAGHLPNLCTLAWAPWIFAGLEDWHRGGGRRSLLVASAAIALQILAGQVQYVFYTAIAAGLHAVAFSVAEPRARRRAVPAALAVYAGAAALAAVQLMPGLAATAEGLRQGRLGHEFASQFSFPPENLLTAIAPGFFGDPTRHPYWGRCYPWEMSLFIGVSGCLVLAVGVSDPERRVAARIDLGIAAVLLVLALGRHTPLFGILYDGVPGFGRFRGWSKFTFPAAAFIVMAIGAGADALLRLRPPRRTVTTASLAVGLAMAGSGAALLGHPDRIAPWLVRIRDTGESYLSAVEFTDPGRVHEAGIQAGRELAIAGFLSLLAGASLRLAGRWKRAGWVVLGLAPLEMLRFAATQSAHFTEQEAVPPELRAFVAAHPGDYRVQNLTGPDNGFLIGAPDLWGNDPGLLRRYAEFIAFTQGVDPSHATQNVDFRSLQPLYGMLRLRYIFTQTGEGFRTFEAPGAMERVQLVSDYRVLDGRDRLFSEMSRPGFNPRSTVLLETEPVPRPEPGGRAGSVRVVEASADRLTIEADVAAPSLLLVTDPYSRDWRARPLPGSSQDHYQVMPADYVLRATPLAAGHHAIRFEYVPTGLKAGIAVSALAWAAWIMLIRGRRRRPASIFRAAILLAACGKMSLSGAPGAGNPAPESTVVWTLDHTGTVGGHTAARVGAPRVVRDAVGGKTEFNGSTDGLIVAANPLAGWPSFSVEVLFRPAHDGPTAQRFLHLEDDAGRRMTFETRLAADGRWALDTFLMDGPSRRPLLDVHRLHPSGSWHWAAIVYDHGRMASFVDGREELSGSVALAPMTGGRVGIGFRMNRVYWFKGEIREIRFHPEAVPAEKLARVQEEP